MGDTDEAERHSGLADAVGGAAMYPARAVARAWRERLETAADEMLSAPEVARIVDRALAGPLPEELARSLARHQVVERVVRELADAGELARLLDRALASPGSLELLDRVLASDEMRRALERVAGGPEVRGAIASQSTGLADQVVARVRVAATDFDGRAERIVRRSARATPPVFAGVGSRGVALAIDAAVTTAIAAGVGVLAGLIAGLVGGVRPDWLAGALLAATAALITVGYFTLFWSTVGQTPGMRLMHLRVRTLDSDGPLGTGRAVLRTIGVALAVIPLFLGFVPALFDARRRALPDFLAGTVVVYAPDLEVS